MSKQVNKQCTVLLVDDEPQIVEFLQMGFSYEGFHVLVATNGPDALHMITEHQPDIVILDIMLPGFDGLTVTRLARRTHDSAIIMLTAKDEVDDMVEGLDVGADDYVTKPFVFKELMARVRAVLRRHGKVVGDELTFQHISLNRSTRLVSVDSEVIELTPREFDLLELFMMHPNQVLTRDIILSRVWGYDYTGDDNIIEVYVRHLREKLHDMPPRLLQTVRGVGYSLRG
ncbi:response regulator transcription factor [Thermosporothrix hazakensis]|uniref:DNA-binding response regulator n=1 Tax=Thermosporothrix sp. COM3 TaxID=2490863 RepID=A0A455SCQ6_9CHLR|nr:response regulator transcription factor [Thermosporothrix hazakensis]BBH85536.1 DNA-binding response regulator [Thermosporothrix sp. COM3]GCE46037.1 DNA-binding response regulator [Thermosporothrix hazakensis]